MNEQRVVNTSPLIYLSRAGLMDLLRMGAGSVAVPREVADEVHAWHTADAAQQALATLAWLSVLPPQNIPAPVLAWDLGTGESAVIAAGIATPGLTLVLDDLAARRCAAAFGLPVRGTLGLVLLAKKRGTIPSARDALRQLRAAGMFLSEAVADRALKSVNE